MSPERLQEMRANAAECVSDVAVGKAAKAFLESPFWTNTLAPELADQREHAKAGALWSPHQSVIQTVDQVAMVNAYNSGVVAQIEIFEKTLREWVRRGDEQRECLVKLEKSIKEAGQ